MTRPDPAGLPRCALDAGCEVAGCTDATPCLMQREPEFDTPHTRDHGVHGFLQPHPHLHGTGPGQHRHSEPDTVPRVAPTKQTSREIGAPVEVQAWGVPVLSDAERRVVGLLAEAWNTLCSDVVAAGPSRDADLAELAAHVHVLQNAVLAQAAARCYPQTYRLMGGSLR